MLTERQQQIIAENDRTCENPFMSSLETYRQQQERELDEAVELGTHTITSEFDEVERTPFSLNPVHQQVLHDFYPAVIPAPTRANGEPWPWDEPAQLKEVA